ncbi:MAG: DUF3108 domain-containing protein [Myxococcales bacterium]|nr:DUF3108 domain-containing protein [Myxococcales bacterium]
MLTLLLAAAAVCPPQKLQAARFTPGEILSYKLDAIGVDVGTFEVRVGMPPPTDKRAALALTSRAKTTAFVSTNVGRYDAFATALLAPDFSPLHYHEDLDEGETHKAVDLDFPPRPDGSLPVRGSTNGNAEPFALSAGSDVRDIISTLYLLRAQQMKPGTPVCVEVFAGRKIWKVSGQMAAHETIETPLGKFATLRIDAESVRADDPRVKRAAHVWVSDDDRRLPLVAIGEVKGKVIRAQLTAVSGHRVAQRKK